MMNFPEWYPDWRNNAFADLKSKNAKLEQVYGIGRGGRYHYDLETASLVFAVANGATSIADIEVAGTTSGQAGNWLWSWANPDFARDLTAGSTVTKSFGLKHGICSLSHDFVSPPPDVSLNALGWELTSAAARLTDSVGAYRCPDDNDGAVYFIIKAIRRVS